MVLEFVSKLFMVQECRFPKTECELERGSFSATLVSVLVHHRVQELCESRGGRHGLSVLTVSVDVKQH